MLRSAAITIIQRGLGFRSDLSDEIIAALQEAQRFMEQGKTLPEFLLQEDQTLTATSGSADIALPTGFIREKQGEGLHYTDSSSGERVYLEKFTNRARLLTSLDAADTDAGKPQAYYIRKATVSILPERDTSYSLTWSYYKKDALLTSDVENEWLEFAPDLLIGKAGMILCEDIGLGDAAMQARWNRFNQRFMQNWQAYIADDILREEEGYSLNMGGRL